MNERTQAEKNEIMTLCQTWNGIAGALSHLHSHRFYLLAMAEARPHFRHQIKDCERRIALLETSDGSVSQATEIDRALLERFGADDLYANYSSHPSVIDRLVRSGLISRHYF